MINATLMPKEKGTSAPFTKDTKSPILLIGVGVSSHIDNRQYDD